jgi:hypothetical protein
MFISFYTLSYIVFLVTNLRHVQVFLSSPHTKMSNLDEFFVCRVHDLYIEIIKEIQTGNE